MNRALLYPVSAQEPLLHSIYCAGGIFCRPAASESLVHSAAVSAVSFLAGKKPLVIAIILFNRGSFVFIVQ